MGYKEKQEIAEMTIKGLMLYVMEHKIEDNQDVIDLIGELESYWGLSFDRDRVSELQQQLSSCENVKPAEMEQKLETIFGLYNYATQMTIDQGPKAIPFITNVKNMMVMIGNKWGVNQAGIDMLCKKIDWNLNKMNPEQELCVRDCYMKAYFERKPESFLRRLKNIKINKVIQLEENDFLNVLEHPLEDYDFIKKNSQVMGCINGMYQCILLVGKNRTDGLLIDSEGASYCRYAAYIPDVTFVNEIQRQKKQEEVQNMDTLT